MKKELLSLFTALIAILSLSFAFTACDDKPDSDDANQINNRMTEEEWIGALNNTYASTNHSIHSETTTDTAGTLAIMDWKIDYTNSVIYSNQKLHSQDGTVSQIAEYYMEYNGKTLIIFQHSDSVWYIGKNEYSTEEEAENYLLRFGALSDFGRFIFGETSEHEGQEATLVEMYDWFNYNAEKDIYTAQFNSLSILGIAGGANVDEGILTLKFAGGKLIYFAQESKAGESNYKGAYEIKYGTVVTIPEEVRNSAQERE